MKNLWEKNQDREANWKVQVETAEAVQTNMWSYQRWFLSQLCKHVCVKNVVQFLWNVRSPVNIVQGSRSSGK